MGLVLFGFWLGFSRSSDLGWQLVWDWALINGGLSALGALIAAAHPLTVITAFVAAPITSLNPTIGAGMITAAAELMLRKPQVGDFSALGSAVGTYLAGFRIFDRLTG